MASELTDKATTWLERPHYAGQHVIGAWHPMQGGVGKNGIELPGIYTLRNVADTDMIKEKVSQTGIKRALIIGAGFMGASVGYVSAKAGIEVVLIDRDQESADKGKAHCKSVIDGLVAKGRAKPADVDALMSRITATPDFNAISDCDLVIESIVEDLATKKALFTELGEHAPEHTIL